MEYIANFGIHDTLLFVMGVVVFSAKFKSQCRCFRNLAIESTNLHKEL